MSRGIEALQRGLRGLAGLILLMLMLVTFVDVIGRYFLGQPLPGGHVLVQCLVCLLIFTALPIIVLGDEHLRVQLLDQRMTPRVRRWRDRTVSFLVAICMLVLAGQLFWQADYFGRNGEYFESIRIPLSWMAWYGAVTTTVAALLAARRFLAVRDATEDGS